MGQGRGGAGVVGTGKNLNSGHQVLQSLHRDIKLSKPCSKLSASLSSARWVSKPMERSELDSEFQHAIA